MFLDFEYIEVVEFDIMVFGEGFYDDVEGYLDCGDYFFLGEVGFFINFEDDFLFG